LIGTFLVRSGVVSSVHSFASDPARGVFILALLVATTGGALALYAVRAPQMRMGNLFTFVSREASLVLNNVFLMVTTGIVFWGTFSPLFLQITTGAQISVGAPWFNLFFVPLAIALMIAMAVGPFLSWKRGDLAGAFSRLKVAGVVALGVIAGTLALNAGWVAIAFGAAAWLLVGSLSVVVERMKFSAGLPTAWARAAGLPRATWGMVIAHCGIAVMALGIASMAVWTTETVKLLKPGESASIASYDVRLLSVRDEQGPNYTAKVGRFAVSIGGAQIDEMVAERRTYPNPGSETTEAALRMRPMEVLYVTVGQGHPSGAWTVRMYHHPFVGWIWGGAVVMVVGGLLSISDRRLRVGAPRRSAAVAAAQPAAAGARAANWAAGGAG
jgi:cytochrome c-type biogenesis protein CcmF